MRHLFAVLSAALAIASTVAHADTLDDFVLTGNGHTYTFSLPASGLFSGEPESGVTNRVRYTQTANASTTDGISSGSVFAQFVLYPGNYGTAVFSIGSPTSTLSDTFYGPVLTGFDPVSISGYTSGPYLGYSLTGSFDLFTRQWVSGQGAVDTPYTLTITPETSTSVTPEPATLTLLATGALGLRALLRRRAD